MTTLYSNCERAKVIGSNCLQQLISLLQARRPTQIEHDRSIKYRFRQSIAYWTLLCCWQQWYV